MPVTTPWSPSLPGYGFITRDDTKEDIFVHQTTISANNLKKCLRSLDDGEVVEFDVVESEKHGELGRVELKVKGEVS